MYIKGRAGQSAFTLVELVVVLIIAGIIAAFVFPRSVNDTLVLAAQAGQVAGDIRYAQSLAMTQGQRFRINFTPSVSPVVYQLGFANGVVATHPVVGAMSVSLNPLVTMTTINLTSNLVGFDGEGTPYSDPGVTTPLSVVAILRLSLNGHSKDVTIQPQTGRVQ